MTSCLVMSSSAEEAIFFSCSPQPTHNQSFAGTSLCSGRSDSMPRAEDYCHFTSEESTQNGA